MPYDRQHHILYLNSYMHSYYGAHDMPVPLSPSTRPLLAHMQLMNIAHPS
jgi:hypothetical protein